MHAIEPRHFLEALFRDTIAAVQPATAVHEALDLIDASSDPLLASTAGRRSRLHLLGMGKASVGMVEAALTWCAARVVIPVGGIVVTHDEAATALPHMHCCIGDHPVPGPRSLAAANALGGYIAAAVQPGDAVLVLLSGGTSSLIGGARHGISQDTYIAISRALLTAGLAIGDMNRLRRRFSRWSGGRLGAQLQARGAHVQVLAMSDVVGDELESIGSGPCIPERSTEAQLDAVLQRASLDARDRTMLRQTLRDVLPLDSEHQRTYAIPHRVVSSSIVAQSHLLLQAGRRGAHVDGAQPFIEGEAVATGASIARRLLQLATAPRGTVHTAPLRVVCWGGEPTVTLPAGDVPPGGRMQALALAAARVLAERAASGAGITLLAAGTDGRDGTTDAAGAIVDAQTWSAVAAAGRDPAADLATHRSHDALRAAGALIPAFVSGINVNDLVVGCVQA